jgi:hypothetical protein
LRTNQGIQSFTAFSGFEHPNITGLISSHGTGHEKSDSIVNRPDSEKVCLIEGELKISDPPATSQD